MTSIVPKGQLVYGMQLQVQAQSKLFVEDWEENAGRDELVAMAKHADDAGFFYLAVCDHVAIPRPADERMGTTWYDTVATLGYLGAVTNDVRLMSHVYVAPYRHPLVTAKSFMTLDELTGGRIILGIGTGHLESEFELLGVPFAERGPMTDEVIDVVRAALDDEYPAVDTPHFHVHDAAMAPRPRQSRVPIWVGGSSKPALRRAAERGDGWLPQGTPRHEMPASISYLLEHRTRTRGDDPIDIGVVTEMLYVGDPDWEVGERTLSGKPEHIAAQLREFGDMGVNHLQVRFRNRTLQELLDQIDAFGSEIAPLLNP
jgi:probable F420-dependent oxidoreductase